MKMTFKQRQLVTVLRNKGYKEGEDFRIVWFGTEAEIKMIDFQKYKNMHLPQSKKVRGDLVNV